MAPTAKLAKKKSDKKEDPERQISEILRRASLSEGKKKGVEVDKCMVVLLIILILLLILVFSPTAKNFVDTQIVPGYLALKRSF